MGDLLIVPEVFYCDVFEPNDTIVSGVKACVPAVQLPLNEAGYADYMWLNLAKKTVMWERKQLGEALSDLDALEEQLHKHLGNCDELNLVVEGVGHGTSTGAQMCKRTNQGWTDKGGHLFTRQSGLWARWQKLKWCLWHECGVYVACVDTWEETMWTLVTAFKACMEEKHLTLQRYTVPHIPQMSKNKHVDNLIRLKGVRIGEVTAEKLIKKYGTLQNVLKASEAELVGLMGGPWASNWVNTVGKEGAWK